MEWFRLHLSCANRGDIPKQNIGVCIFPKNMRVGGYSATNLILNYDGFRHVTMFARIDNVFNTRFHEYLGFPNPGIACRVGVTYRLP